MKKMKRIIMLGVLMFSVMAFSINVYANNDDYNNVGSTFAHTPTTYTVGSGASPDTAGVTGYNGDSYYKILTTNSIGRRNNPILVFYKGDIIEFVADVAKSSSREGASYGLDKGFIIVGDSWNNITTQYAEVLDSVVSGDKTVYQKIKITSDLPVQLLFKGAGPTGYATEPNSLRQTWSDRVVYFNIGIFNKSAIPLTYNLNGGEFYGSATPPTSLYVSSNGYTFNLPVVYKEGYAFTGWSASNMVSFDDSAKLTAKVSGVTSWGPHSSSGSISVRESVTLTASFTSLSMNNVTITLNANGGKIDGYASRIYNTTISPAYNGNLSGFGISNYIPIKSGSTFEGWYLDQEFTKKVTQDSDVSYKIADYQTKTLYAKWKAVPTPVNTYSVTINSGTGFTTDLTSPKTVNENDDLEITITANTGYKLKSVKIDNVEQTLPLTNNKIVLTDITKNMNILVVAEKITYNFDDNSKGVTYTVGTDEELSLRVKDATIDNFDKVYVNDKVLDSKYYTVKSGSIIVNVKDSYLKTLKNGEYSIKVLTKDGGEATSSFVIANSSIIEEPNTNTNTNTVTENSIIEEETNTANSSIKEETNPKTGDGIMYSIIIGSTSLIALFGIGIYLKKRTA